MNYRHKRPKVMAAIKLASDATGVPPEAIMTAGHRGSRKMAEARRIAVLNLYEGKGQDVLYNQSEVARCFGMNHTSVRDIVNACGISQHEEQT